MDRVKYEAKKENEQCNVSQPPNKGAGWTLKLRSGMSGNAIQTIGAPERCADENVGFFSNLLGSIKLGQSLAEIDAILGTPDAIMPTVRAGKALWKFGSLELSFLSDRLIIIALQLETAKVALPRAVAPREDLIKIPRSINAFLEFLKIENILYRKNDALSFAEQVCYRIDPNVEIIGDLVSGEVTSVQSFSK